MRKFCARLVSLVPLVSGVAHAMCAGDLTVDQKYARLRVTSISEVEYRRQLSRLSNETFTPILDQISRTVLATSRSKIISEAAHLEGERLDFAALLKPYEESPPYALYSGGIESEFEVNVHAPFVAHNAAVMYRLWQSVTFMERVVKDLLEADLNSQIEDAVDFLHAHSFTELDLREAFGYAHETILQTGAFLTASKVEGWSPERLLRHVFSGTGRTSLAVHFALALGPAYLGQHGNVRYVKNCLVKLRPAEGTEMFRFSDDLCGVLREHRQQRAQEGYLPHEFSFGCPVAHALNRGESSALQRYLDAILYVYEILD